jgi:endonuclease-8
MPEGPTILMMAEEAQKFVGRPVRAASGNAKIAYSRLLRRKPAAIRSWGKHFLMDFGDFSVRAHLLLFGSYRIDDTREKPPRLALRFANGELNIYGGSVKLVDGPLADDYDWRIDVLSDDWDAARARKSVRARPDALACDVLMDQQTFAGVGNIIKNEVLHRIGVHPAARIDELTTRQVAALVRDARDFSFQFLAWRRQNVLRKNCRVHTRKYCADCGTELRRAILGTTQRRAFWCDVCQPLPAGADPARAIGKAFGESWWTRRSATKATKATTVAKATKGTKAMKATKVTKVTKARKATKATTAAKTTKPVNAAARPAKRPSRSRKLRVKDSIAR